jgi:hypothetical protein
MNEAPGVMGTVRADWGNVLAPAKFRGSTHLFHIAVFPTPCPDAMSLRQAPFIVHVAQL